MNSEISVFAPAKINLFLEVTGKRGNGYHDIETLFAKIAIGDNIKISAAAAQQTSIELKVKGPFGDGLKANKTNLVYKAAGAFFEHFGIKAKCAIRLEKNIPLASGLGGGSSDAAAVITALCALFNIEINAKRMKDLVKLTAGLGADIPFFLYKDTFARGSGIGEVLTPIKNHITSPSVIVVYPNEHSGTKEAYNGLKLNGQEEILTNVSALNKLISSIEGGNSLNEWRSLIYNKLEDCVLAKMDSVSKLKNELLTLGTDVAAMSGSGSCVFALVEDRAKAEQIVRKISGNNKTVFLTHFWGTRHENNRNKNTSNGGRTP
jgi:4-diphosphocytidyl-2-C-methyl-D-erythritol kinase